MDIIISNASGKPIYEQIVSQIKQLILSNALQAGDALPSMRLLAKDLRISVITTKRAYEELEREGFIETIVGKGSFVASKNEGNRLGLPMRHCRRGACFYHPSFISGGHLIPWQTAS